MPKSNAQATARGEGARRRLLAAAAQLAAERGWGAVTTRVLAARAEVNAGLVHYHFGSVEDLLRQAALGVMAEALAGARATIASAPDPAALADRLLANLDGFSGTDPVSLLFTETCLAATRDEELRARLTVLLEDFVGVLADRLGEFRHPEPEAAARVLAASLDGLVLYRALAPEATSAPVVAPAIRRLIAVNSSTAGGEAR